jgi:TPR repeat protein
MKKGIRFLFFILLVMIIPIASVAGPLEDGTDAMEQGDYQTAYKLLYPLAEQGEAAAQDCIASMFCEGLGVEKDEAQAMEWFQKAADQNYAQAQNALGAMYVNGLGTEKDVQKGMTYILKAAQQGLELAQRNYYQLNLQEAQDGNFPALHNVGLMCLKGWGGDTDPQSCVKLLETAAQYGYTKSASTLSKIYQKGKFGIAADPEKAKIWQQIAETPPEQETPVAN